jgi:molybdopterin converting factor small subunit
MSDKMRVKVKVFATLVHHVPNAVSAVPFEVELAESARVDDLVAQLKLPVEDVKLVFVNGRARPPEWVLQPGDELGIFPPVGGG